MAQVRTKLLIAAGVGLASALLVAAALLFLGGGPRSSSEAGAGDRAISLVGRDQGVDGREALFEIARLAVRRDGTFALSVIKEGSAADKARAALEALRGRRTLGLLVEEEKDHQGKPGTAAQSVEVAPGDPRFVWAVVSFLRRDYGFECEVR